MPTSSGWTEYAGGNSGFANWLEHLDHICIRFINVDFSHIIEAGDFDVYDAFFHMAVTPEQYLREMIIPYLKNEYGADFLEENLYDQVCWGGQGKHEEEDEDQAR